MHLDKQGWGPTLPPLLSVSQTLLFSTLHIPFLPAPLVPPAPLPHVLHSPVFCSSPTIPRSCPGPARLPPQTPVPSSSVWGLEISYYLCYVDLWPAASQMALKFYHHGGLFLSLEPPLPLCPASCQSWGCLYSKGSKRPGSAWVRSGLGVPGLWSSTVHIPSAPASIAS